MKSRGKGNQWKVEANDIISNAEEFKIKGKTMEMNSKDTENKRWGNHDDKTRRTSDEKEHQVQAK